MTDVPLLPEELDGHWSLVSYFETYDDGRMTTPLGDSPRGIITYAGGRMSCVMTSSDRPTFRRGDPAASGEGAKAAAFDTCVAYAGTVVVGPDWVDHVVDVSLFPNWNGTTQHRVARLDKDHLHLTARLEEQTPDRRTAQLLWRRLPAGTPLSESRL